MLLLRAVRSAFTPTHLNKIKRLNPRRLMGLQRKSGSASDEQDDTPLKYSESPALNWKARDSRLGGRIHGARLWYEPYVVVVSVAVFLVYFLVLREENDVDEELNKSLYSRVPGLEEKQLLLVLEHNKQSGLDSTAIRERLKEIEEERKRAEV